MTSTAKQDLYQHANDLNCTLRDVRSSGRNWQGAVRDALHPTRPEMGFGMHDFERCKNQITAYCDRRTGWVQANPIAASEKVIEVVREVPAAHSAVQVLEVPGGFTQDDLDAAVNDAIQELMQNMGTIQPMTYPELLDSTTTGMVPATKLADAEARRQRLLKDMVATEMERDEAREEAKLLTRQVQKRDAVILTLNEDFTRLLAESEARSQERYDEFSGIYADVYGDINKLLTRRFNEAKASLADTAAPDERERDRIAARQKGWQAHVSKGLASVGLATDGTTITPLKEAE